MVLTPSQMLSLGTEIPDFSLPEVTTDKYVSPDDFKEKKALLVMFICRHCPYVKHVQAELARLGRDYERSELGIVAISANDARNYPEDGPDSLAEQARKLDFRFPYLYDESQQVARAFKAACTPDFYLFGADRTLVYRGQLDDSRPGNGIPVTGDDLRGAIDATLADKPIPADQKPSVGCNIKWKE